VLVGRPANERPIQSVAACAGSGASVFKSLPPDVDLLFTGELSHHEVLGAVEKGKYVILCGHTNTERGYLRILRRNLQERIEDKDGLSEIDVVISRKDRDPLVLM
jgi:putative NIF3 family GTP cyclohydrolase 1 type 2